MASFLCTAGRLKCSHPLSFCGIVLFLHARHLGSAPFRSAVAVVVAAIVAAESSAAAGNEYNDDNQPEAATVVSAHIVSTHIA